MNQPSLEKETMQTNRAIAMLVDDMFFAAKIRGAAGSAGCEVRAVKALEQIEEEFASNPPALFLLDLNSQKFDPLSTIQFLKSHAVLNTIPIVGFLSHVQIDLKRQAEAAGCDFVIPRSKCSQLLPQLVAGDLSGLSSSPRSSHL